MSLAAAVLLYPSGLWAQAHTGSVYGRLSTVADSPLAGASISVSSAGVSRTAASDERGLFRILNLPPGSYRLEITATGYWPLVHDALVVSVGRSASIDANLTRATEQVNVVAPRSSLERRQVMTGSALDQ
ncbi:MAG TPA: carboxypeptidase-like regulatory domain-containing protein, partial [Vicinamibacterales bacterium]|nr:carboxypeptidase-like regulatory domain-containing protein [Vicinamibacterales bacterium]